MKGKLSLVLLAFILFLFGCQKGDVGPSGPAGPDANQKYINGAFAGTVTGIKRDGSPLKENFNYQYANGVEGYTKSSPPTLYLYRAENYGNNLSILSMSLKALDKGSSNQNILLSADNSTYFSFSKETSSTSLYSVSSRFIPMGFNVVIPIDTLKKSTYPLDFSFNYFVNGGSAFWGVNNYSSLIENGQYHYGFSTVDGATVYFSEPNSTGSFYKIVDAAGNTSNTSSIYGGLTLKFDANNNFIFYSGATNLSLTVPMKADTYSITNYKYDTSTATLSFNYTMRLG